MLKQFAIKDFYGCLHGSDFAFLRKDQLREARVPLIKRYYIAESNFMLLLLRSGLEESDDLFSSLPVDVQNAFTRSTWDAIDKSSDYNRQNPQSDREVTEYFDRTLEAFERANPLLRQHIMRNGGSNKEFLKRAIDEYEKDSSYLFRPELSSEDPWCGLKGKSPRVIIVDIPFFQLALTKNDGRFRVVRMPFHID